ncbi:hypothetical protein C5167_010217 [Papaver somniferum]|uniref:Leucine-rich repeat-containing N-terminal plant-type domain-containing protein n=1 Tax=Papaver somniferum TaxID=3469 RepID=A0A4Y7JZL6_PAPSO|nr:probably inactive leucine-rich repeat receptor-like protein kinase At2g25790 [Papaver somniferum]RZC66523.1 hypothetical protein C5167_010217 [Papaver somniferum]
MGTQKLSLLFLLLVSVIVMLKKGESKTDAKEIEGLKELRNKLDSKSVTPGSCLSSWDFSVDPCDHINTDVFTCGFRCEPDDVSGIKRVTDIIFDQAGYTGSLANSSWNFPYLVTLDVSRNYLSGSIPESISALTRLRRLGFSGNSFTGELPASLGYLTNLEELYLDNNRLQGAIPESFNGLVSLKRLELQGNKISGEIPDLSSLKNLTFLDASDNGISGNFPATLPSSLMTVIMRNNYIQGNLPDNILNLEFLQVMDLSHNLLSGSVISALFSHPSLQQLTLSHNKLTYVQVPRNLGTESELIALDLSNNELEGLLPAFMALMPKLSALSVENNRFTGMIPSQYAIKTVVPDEGSSPFVRLLLGGNYLFGPIPGPLMALKPGTAIVSLVNNCLFRCPTSFFFCQGGIQKSLLTCTSNGPVIP